MHFFAKHYFPFPCKTMVSSLQFHWNIDAFRWTDRRKGKTSAYIWKVKNVTHIYLVNLRSYKQQQQQNSFWKINLSRNALASWGLISVLLSWDKEAFKNTNYQAFHQCPNVSSWTHLKAYFFQKKFLGKANHECMKVGFFKKNLWKTGLY